MPPPSAEFPCAVLTYDNWNDWGWETLHELRVFIHPDEAAFEGTVKILQRGTEETAVPGEFSVLDPNQYCALGQSLSFYRDIAALDSRIWKSVLQALNDVVYQPKQGDDWFSVEGFETSLLRFAEAQKAFNIGGTYLGRAARAPGLDVSNFVFATTVDGAAAPHRVEFDFFDDKTGLHRMMAVIGRNGTGKTQFLARLATSVARGDRGTFQPKRPWFSKVIAISYSIFDDFERPEGDASHSYTYCGVRAPPKASDSDLKQPDQPSRIHDQQLLSAAQIRAKVIDALTTVAELKRTDALIAALTDLLGYQVNVQSLIADGALSLPDFGRLSSGQRMLTLVLTELVAAMEAQALVLYDEPELYLHPDALSALARAFHRILDTFDSFAVLSTHSPLLLQEIPARRVRIFSRQGDVPMVDDLQIESFGESLTVISDTIFQATPEQQNYRTFLARLAEGRTAESVLNSFTVGGGLGLNARMALQSLKRSSTRDR